MASELLTEIEGEISTENIPCMHVEWEVPWILLESTGIDRSIHSPSFNFKDASWHLLVKTYSCFSESESVDLYLAKCDASALTSHVNYHIGIKTVDNRTFWKNFSDSLKYVETGLQCWGTSYVLRRSQVLEKETSFVSNGVITFFCYFWMDAAETLHEGTGANLSDDRSKAMASHLLNKDTGKIFIEMVTVKYVEWKVRDIHLLPEYNEYQFRTSDFKFKDETWYLQITIQEIDEEYDLISGLIEFFLVRMDCATPSRHIDYTIGIKEVDEKTRRIARCEGIIRRNLECVQSPRYLSKLDDCIINAPKGEVTFSLYLLLVNNRSFDESFRTKTTEDNDGFKPFAFSSSPMSGTTATTTTTTTGTSKLIKDLKNLFISSEDSDLLIKVKGTEFKVHKNILRARSSVFHSMLAHDMVEKNSETIDIIDCEPESFKIFLIYLYNGCVENLSVDTVFDLYRASDKYDAEDLKLQCKDFMLSHLSIDTVCDVIEHSIQYNEKELLKIATEFFGKNFKTIILTVKWQSFLMKNTIAANELLIKASNYYVLKE